MNENLDPKILTYFTKLFERSTTVDRNGCHIWGHYVNYDGYGRFALVKRPQFIRDYFYEHHNIKWAVASHRLAYLVYIGDYCKEKPYILHSCGNRLCCNPDHLRADTAKANTNDAILAGLHADTSKYRRNPAHIANSIRKLIIQHKSFYSISQEFRVSITVVRHHAKQLEKQGHVLTQRKKPVDL